MTIGEKVKKLRIEQGLTQKELAEKCGYGSLSAINKVEYNAVFFLVCPF